MFSGRMINFEAAVKICSAADIKCTYANVKYFCEIFMQSFVQTLCLQITEDR